MTDPTSTTSLTWDGAPDLMTLMEAAAMIRISRSAAYESARSGDLRPITVRFGRRILIPKGALRQLIDGEATSDVTEAS